MLEIIDSHAHLTWDSFEQDQSEVITRAFEKNVAQIVQAGVDFNSIAEMQKIAETYKQIFFAVGLHPHEAKLWDDSSEKTLSDTAMHPKCVGIGECGLDYYYNHSSQEQQLYTFRKQIELAVRLQKPLIIHTRDAWEDTLTTLEELAFGKIQGVFHCFTGGPDIISRINKLNFYVSFSGIITFNKTENIQEAAKLVPSNRILVETDCPYLAPKPFRGKRNEPSYVWHTAEKLAQLRQTTVAEIASQTVQNTRALFPELLTLNNEIASEQERRCP